MKVDVRHERDLDRAGDLAKRGGGLLIRARDADDIRSGVLELTDLGASAVMVLVIDWTVIGASPPTSTEPTFILRETRRSIRRHGR
jgi:hypothetical protein